MPVYNCPFCDATVQEAIQNVLNDECSYAQCWECEATFLVSEAHLAGSLWAVQQLISACCAGGNTALLVQIKDDLHIALQTQILIRLAHTASLTKGAVHLQSFLEHLLKQDDATTLLFWQCACKDGPSLHARTPDECYICGKTPKARPAVAINELALNTLVY